MAKKHLTYQALAEANRAKKAKQSKKSAEKIIEQQLAKSAKQAKPADPTRKKPIVIGNVQATPEEAEQAKAIRAKPAEQAKPINGGLKKRRQEIIAEGKNRVSQEHLDSTKPENGKPSLAAFIAKLADQHGINPADVPGHQPCQEALRKAKVAKVSPATLHEARILHRQGIQQTMAKVAQHNAKVMDRMMEEIISTPPASSPEEKQTQAAISKAVKELVRIVPETKAAKPQATTGQSKRVAIFGHAATAVIRAMGVQGFSFEEARKGMDRVGGQGIADATIKIQLAAGKKGERGDPAKLTAAQIATLKG